MLEIKITHKNTIVVWIFLAIFLGLEVHTGSEDFTLSTTYPAPFALHNDVTVTQALVLVPQSNPPANPSAASLYYDLEDNKIYQYNELTQSWAPGGGSSEWRNRSNHITSETFASVVLGGNTPHATVGGTDPQAALTISGELLGRGNLEVDGEIFKR